MSQIRELLVDELRDLLDAEQQIAEALPKMAQAAGYPPLKTGLEIHLHQTEEQIARLEQIFDLLGEDKKPKPCKAMKGLLEEGRQKLAEAEDKEEQAADLSLISAAQKVEHYEISAYGTVRTLARQIGELEVARLLSQSLGEEEASDAILTMCAKPLLQQATLEEWEEADEAESRAH